MNTQPKRSRRCAGMVAIRREWAFVREFYERKASERNPDIATVLWAALEELGPEGHPTDEDLATARAWLATVCSFDEDGRIHLMRGDLPPAPDCEEAT